MLILGCLRFRLGFRPFLRSSFGFFGAGVVKVSLGELQFSRTLLQGFCQGLDRRVGIRVPN